MTSINTNNSAMAALATLNTINASLTKTQNQVSSGLRVQKASDNAAYWSIATTMKSNVSAQSAVKDAIGLGKALLDVTYNGMDQIKDELSTVRNLVVTAAAMPAPATDGQYAIGLDADDPVYDQSQLAKVDEEIRQHLQQMSTIVDASSFNGVNLLKNEKGAGPITGATTDFVAGYANGQVLTIKLDKTDTVMVNNDRSSDGELNTQSQGDIGLLDGGLDFALLTPLINDYNYSTNSVEPSQLPYFLQGGEQSIKNFQADGIPNYGDDRQEWYNRLLVSIDQRMTAVTSAMSAVGSVQKQMDIQDNYTSTLIDDGKSGIGKLIDANMESSSSKLAALQTQQQLAVQSLSISNSTPSNILKLFQQ